MHVTDHMILKMSTINTVTLIWVLASVEISNGIERIQLTSRDAGVSNNPCKGV